MMINTSHIQSQTHVSDNNNKVYTDHLQPCFSVDMIRVVGFFTSCDCCVFSHRKRHKKRHA